MQCKICQKTARKAFEARVLGRFDAPFYKCESCGFLFAKDPHWLPLAYESAINVSDTGIVARNLWLYKVATCVMAAFFAPKNAADSRRLDSEHSDSPRSHPALTRRDNHGGIANLAADSRTLTVGGGQRSNEIKIRESYPSGESCESRESLAPKNAESAAPAATLAHSAAPAHEALCAPSSRRQNPKNAPTPETSGESLCESAPDFHGESAPKSSRDPRESLCESSPESSRKTHRESCESPEPKLLDFGGGSGLLVRLLRDVGIDAYYFDEYCENLFARGFEFERLSAAKNPPKIALITSFEVFEHLPNPRETIEEILSISPNVLFSTELLPSVLPKHDGKGAWWYYGFAHAQHIGFYAPETLRYIAKQHGLHLVSCGSVHLFSQKRVNPLAFKILVKLANRGLFGVFKRRFKSKTISDYKKLR